MFKNLETERLLLKSIDKNDRDFIFKEFTNDFINNYLYDEEPMTNISDADDLIGFYTIPEPRNQHRWILLEKESSTKLGTCGFHLWDKSKNEVEIGFELLQEFNGKGFMLEAVKAIIGFSQQTMNIKKIIAIVFIENTKCIQLLEKMKFKILGEEKTEFRNRVFLHKIYELHV